MFIGINIAFIVTHATPIDPVEQSIAAATQYGSTSPEAIALMRQSLRELYGLEGGLGEQYLAFWRRVAVGDFGPSLSAFPTPVAVLIGRALPWTVGAARDLDPAHLGAGQSPGRPRRLLPRRAARCAWPACWRWPSIPIPYYIVAFLLLIVFGYLWPILPISGGYEDEHAARLELGIRRQPASAMPSCRFSRWRWSGWAAGSWACARWSPTSSPRTTSSMPSWAASSAGASSASYVMRNALVPQVTGLAMSLGAIFNGAIITEQVFGYPGVGTLLVSAVHAGDYSLVLGITTVSIVAVSFAVLLIDLALSAARSPGQGRAERWAARSSHLLRFNRQFAVRRGPAGRRRGLRLPVLLLALPAQRQLRRAARPAAVAGTTRWARRRAARTCSGC